MSSTAEKRLLKDLKTMQNESNQSAGI